MPENNDANAGTGSGERDDSPAPIFVSFIYDFMKTESTLSGEPGGKAGTLGGPINGKDPVFKVFTYPFIPTRGEDI